jgi:conjugative relaxase-like TrwC/TraI family protein
VRFTVTPIGATPGDEAGAARRIGAYLLGTAPQVDRPALASAAGGAPGGGVVGYYRADQSEGGSWWGGRGAWRLGLAGAVEAPVLESVLVGRHPVTEERLLSAQGSAGRGSLKRGEYTRLLDGRQVWDLDEAAARFATDPDRLATALPEVDHGGVVVDGSGRRWLTRSGIEQLARIFGAPPVEHGDVLAALRALPGDGVVSVAEAARLTGLSEQHFRQVIGEWHRNRDRIEAGIDGLALPHERAWLPAVKERGRWRITVRDLVGYWERRSPPAVRVAYDVVATVEKSVAVLALLGDAEVRAGCVEALLAANEAGMDWLDEHASRGRRQGESVSSEGLVRAGFLHATSRALDPHPHVHNLVVNAIEDPHGEGRAVDARHLYQQAKAASAIATGQLRWELARRWPGIRWEQRARSGVWELAGVGEGVIAEFSTRKDEIESAARLLVGADGDALTRTEIQEISASTRPAKQTVDVAALLANWQARADRHGFDPAAVTGHAPARRFPPELDPGERAALFGFLATSPDGVCAHDSTFGFGDVLAAINRWRPDGQPRPLPADQLVRVANEFLATDLALPTHQVHRANVPEDRWTTPLMVRTQAQIFQDWHAGLYTGALTAIPPRAVDTVVVRAGLTAEQADLVRAWTTSGHQFQAAIGRPGTGKTYTMTAARRLWEAHGWRVVGAAVKGTAAQHLTAETGIPADTVARLLVAAAHGHTTLDERTILVVDEATTLSDRDLAALLRLATTTGAVLRMIGDPHQQQSVAAGGMWAHLATLHPDDTPELVDQRRLQDPVEAWTAELLRSGRVAEAVDQLLAAGKVRLADDEEHGERLALVGWLDRRRRGVDGPMVIRRNHSRRRLNQIAQAILAITGEVTDLCSYATGRFGVGDRVIATAPDRGLHPDGRPDRYLANGTTGTVTRASPQGVTVEFDGLGVITVPAERVGLLDLGYALTAYSVQGATLDEAEVTATRGEPLESLYVALTRGRHANTLIVTPPPVSEAHQPDPGHGGDPVVELTRTITARRPTPALVADPDLVHLLDPAGAPPQIRSQLLQAARDRAVRLARLDPPAGFLARHGPRPATPWRAEAWDHALTSEISEQVDAPLRVEPCRAGLAAPPEPAGPDIPSDRPAAGAPGSVGKGRSGWRQNERRLPRGGGLTR